MIDENNNNEDQENCPPVEREKKKKKSTQTARKSTTITTDPVDEAIEQTRQRINEGRLLRSSVAPPAVGLGRGKGGQVRATIMQAYEHRRKNTPRRWNANQHNFSSNNNHSDMQPETSTSTNFRDLQSDSSSSDDDHSQMQPGTSSNNDYTREQQRPIRLEQNASRSVDLNNSVLDSVSNASLLKARIKARNTRLLRDIRRYENDTNFSIPRATFIRYVREVGRAIKSDLKFQNTALIAMQQSVECFLVSLYEHANYATIHAGRVTLFVKDIHLAQRMAEKQPFKQLPL